MIDIMVGISNAAALRAATERFKLELAIWTLDHASAGVVAEAGRSAMEAAGIVPPAFEQLRAAVLADRRAL